MDSDIVVLKPISFLNNSVGMENQVNGSALNGAVMAFEKNRYCLASNYRSSCSRLISFSENDM